MGVCVFFSCSGDVCVTAYLCLYVCGLILKEILELSSCHIYIYIYTQNILWSFEQWLPVGSCKKFAVLLAVGEMLDQLLTAMHSLPWIFLPSAEGSSFSLSPIVGLNVASSFISMIYMHAEYWPIADVRWHFDANV